MNGSSTENSRSASSPIHLLDPRVKIVASLLIVLICVSTPSHYHFAFAAYLAIVVAAILISRAPLLIFLKRWLVVLPFVLVVLVSIPFISQPFQALWNVLIKSTIAILTLTLLSQTTPFNEILEGLERMRVPRIFIMIGSFMYRYVWVLLDEITRMKRARDSRLYGGRWLPDAKTIGMMIGSLFLRSYERAERLYVAMVSRGYEGRSPGA
jgi:cobalt/nickel transport system permease protein